MNNIPLVYLTKYQIDMLDTFISYKSQFRKQYWQERVEKFSYPSFDEIVNELIQLKLIRKSKNNALTLTLEYKQAKTLIDLNTKTVDDIKTNIASYDAAVEAQRLLVDDMLKDDKYKSWPNSMQLDNEFAMLRRYEDQLKYYNALLKYKAVFI